MIFKNKNRYQKNNFRRMFINIKPNLITLGRAPFIIGESIPNITTDIHVCTQMYRL